jgi:Ca2+-binding RTX toxin-like protein
LQLDLYSETNEILDALWEGGVTKFLDGDKPILYGTVGADEISAEQADDYPYLEPYVENGVVILGGSGGDAINGGDGKDWLLGGNGDDVIHGGERILLTGVIMPTSCTGTMERIR